MDNIIGHGARLTEHNTKVNYTYNKREHSHSRSYTYSVTSSPQTAQPAYAPTSADGGTDTISCADGSVKEQAFIARSPYTPPFTYDPDTGALNISDEAGTYGWIIGHFQSVTIPYSLIVGYSIFLDTTGCHYYPTNVVHKVIAVDENGISSVSRYVTGQINTTGSGHYTIGERDIGWDHSKFPKVRVLQT